MRLVSAKRNVQAVPLKLVKTPIIVLYGTLSWMAIKHQPFLRTGSEPGEEEIQTGKAEPIGVIYIEHVSETWLS